MHAVRVSKSSELETALREAFEHEGTALVEVMMDRQELSMPPSMSAAQMKSFTLYALRTVLSGRGDAVIELAKTNLRQIL